MIKVPVKQSRLAAKLLDICDDKISSAQEKLNETYLQEHNWELVDQSQRLLREVKKSLAHLLVFAKTGEMPKGLKFEPPPIVIPCFDDGDDYDEPAKPIVLDPTLEPNEP
jgi:hypothetical protein